MEKFNELEGEPEIIVLKRETAYSQTVNVMNNAHLYNNGYLLDMNCFKGHDREYREYKKKLDAFIKVRSVMSANPINLMA